jgi:hypothetical protein
VNVAAVQTAPAPGLFLGDRLHLDLKSLERILERATDRTFIRGRGPPVNVSTYRATPGLLLAF